jgi:predicted RNA-binding protein with PIN domain
MSQHYYIDGYNVMHKSSLLRPLAMEDFEAAREALVDKVAQFCVATGRRATIVFDGRNRHQPEKSLDTHGVSQLEVLYSPATLSADAVIERRVYRESNKLEVVVISNDRGLRDLCRNMGALTMEADHFLSSVHEVRREATERYEAPARSAMTEHLEDRLDGDTLARLKALKEKL